MDEIAPEYDTIVLGTGRLQFVPFLPRSGANTIRRSYRMCSLRVHLPPISLDQGTDQVSVLSVKGQKVLHIDRNDHYGGLVINTSLLGSTLR